MTVSASCRCRRSASLARDHARLSRRSSASQQGSALSLRPADREEIVAVMCSACDDRHGDRLRAMIVVLWRGGLPSRRRSSRRTRPRSGAWVAACSESQGWSPPRGRHGRLGLGHLARGCGARRAAGRPAVLRHRRPGPRAPVVERQRARRVSPTRRPGGDPTPLYAAPVASRPRARVAREGVARTASSANSVTPTSARPRSTSKASTPKRSSPSSTPGARR